MSPSIARASLGVAILNVHAQGGAAMMRAALDAARTVSPSTKVIAVTMLTSLSDEDLPSVGLTPPVGDQVLRLVARGMNNRDIAKELFISENTVKNHVRNILEKLQIHSRMEAVMIAVREKLIEFS